MPQEQKEPRMDLETVDYLLTTTRSVRRRLDLNRPVEPELIEECIEIALQAPSGSNLQGWNFVVVTDPERRRKLADIYRKGGEVYNGLSNERPMQFAANDLRSAHPQRVRESNDFLLKHLHEVPVLIVPCVDGRMEEAPYLAELEKHGGVYWALMYGSILPATWSLMLALRSRGVGSLMTTNHLVYSEEAARVLGIPDYVIQAALLPVAYYTGSSFRRAKRLPGREVTHWNAWGQRR
jgi:nitroreductase